MITNLKDGNCGLEFETYDEFTSWFHAQDELKSTDKIQILIKKANEYNNPIVFNSALEVMEAFEEGDIIKETLDQTYMPIASNFDGFLISRESDKEDEKEVDKDKLIGIEEDKESLQMAQIKNKQDWFEIFSEIETDVFENFDIDFSSNQNIQDVVYSEVCRRHNLDQQQAYEISILIDEYFEG